MPLVEQLDRDDPSGERPGGPHAGLRGEAGELTQRGEPRQRLALELPDALSRQVELVADRLERPGLALEAEAELEDAPLALRERVERPTDALAAERLLGLVERVGGLAVGEEVAELALVVGAHGLIQGDRRLRRPERLVDVLDRQARGLRELGLRRLAPELDLEPARRARQLLLALDDVDGHANGARVIRDRALHRLADPPGRVGRELVAAPPVELLDRAVQAEGALLDQVEERHAQAAVALGDRHDEPEVRLDHAPLRDGVAALDRLRERDLLGRVQQLVAADVGEEELQRVGGAADLGRLDRRGLGLLLLGLGRRRLPDLEPDALELAHDLLDLDLGEVVLEREGLEVRGLDEAALLGALDEQARLVGVEQFVQLVRRQLVFPTLSTYDVGGASSFRTVGRGSLSFQGEPPRGAHLSFERVPETDYSAAVGWTAVVRVGNSNSILPSSFKTRRARKGLPFLERKPDRTSRVRPSSSSCRATSGVSVRPATRFQITNPHPGSSRLFQLVHP